MAYAEELYLFALEQGNALRKKPATSSTPICVLPV